MSDLGYARTFPNTCNEEVARNGELQACEKTAVAVRRDPHDRNPYPVCGFHARGDMVPLAELFGEEADVSDEPDLIVVDPRATEQSAEEIVRFNLSVHVGDARAESIAAEVVAALRSSRLLLPEGAETTHVIQYGIVAHPARGEFTEWQRDLTTITLRGEWVPVEEDTK